LHPNRAEIDRRLASERVNIAALARALGVNRKALERHRDRHVPSLLADLRTRARDASASRLVEQLERHYHLVLDALAAAEGAALSHIDGHRLGPAASHAAIAASVNEARQHLADLAELFVVAAEAGHLAEPHDPAGNAQIRRALDRVAARASALASTA
jgi:hypothetical protein